MSYLYVVVLVALVGLLSWPLGVTMARVLSRPTSEPDRVDRGLARVLGAGVLRDQTWPRYAASLVLLNAAFFVVAFAVVGLQHVLPGNPDHRGPVPPSLLFHTVMSFVTNTNLQHYAGEQALSYLSQLTLTWLQFVSAASGIAALAVIARLLGPVGGLGNLYRDVARVVLLLLLPLSLALGAVLLFAGVPMTLDGAAVAHTLEGAVQTLVRGPVAAMVAIKQLGTNGGGFFGPNSTHPFEDPSLFTGVLEQAAVFWMPMASVWMFGRLVGRVRHVAVVFAVMGALFVGLSVASVAFESAPSAVFDGLSVDTSGGNLEGKELRLGTAMGSFWAAATTATSNGSVAAMHDSLNPLTGLVPLTGMFVNVAFGGVGVGMINMLLYILVAVFIAGLMVGRTPEYLGKKVEAREMKLVALALLLHPLLILGGTALFAGTAWGPETIANPGSHGFTEVLYEMSSAAANNGSGFEGLADGTVAWNVATGLAMFFGRYVPIVLPLAAAASLASKKAIPDTAGTFRTDTVLFGLLLLGSLFLLGALLFLPAAVLGPIAEHLALAGAP